MPNSIKYSTTTPSGSLQKGNVALEDPYSISKVKPLNLKISVSGKIEKL